MLVVYESSLEENDRSLKENNKKGVPGKFSDPSV